MRVTEPYTLFPRKLQSGKTVYYYQYRMENGTRSSPKSTGCTTLSSAKRFCNKLYNSGEFEKTSSTRFDIFTQDFFSKESEYYRWKQINNSRITDNTLLRYNVLLKYQLMPYFANYQLKAITKSEVKQWVIWASEKWSAKTVNNAQTVLNIILNQAVDKDIIEYNPAMNLSFRKVEKKHRELLTIDEFRNCYNSPLWNDDSLRSAFLVAVITGMRISEIAGLKNENVFENYIDVKASYNRQFGLGETKTKQCRKVPIPQELKLHNENSEWLFPSAKGKPFNIVRILDKLHVIWDSLDIDYKQRNLNTHTIRNFFISYLESENVPEPKIRATVGHKDSSMTGLYTYWEPSMLKEVYDAQSKLFKEITNAKN